MVTSLCLLCTTVSQMNSPMAHTLSQKQTLHGYVANNWSYGHFCYICAHFGQNLVAVATSHRPVQAAMSSLDWLTTKTPVTSNRILVISRRNAFVCIYSNFSPKIGCHGNAPLPLYGSVTYEFPDSTNPISKPESAWICCIQPGLLTKLANRISIHSDVTIGNTDTDTSANSIGDTFAATLPILFVVIRTHIFKSLISWPFLG